MGLFRPVAGQLKKNKTFARPQLGYVWGTFLFDVPDSDLAVDLSPEPTETKYAVPGLCNNPNRELWSTTFLSLFLSTPIQNNRSLSSAF